VGAKVILYRIEASIKIPPPSINKLGDVLLQRAGIPDLKFERNLLQSC